MRIQPKAVLTHELQAGEAFPQGQHRPLHGHLPRQQVLLASPLGKRKQRPDLIVLHRCHRVPAATPQRPQIFGSAEFHFFSSPCFPALGQPTGRKKKKKWGQRHRCQPSSVRVALLRAASPLAIWCARPEAGTGPGDTGQRERRGER